MCPDMQGQRFQQLLADLPWLAGRTLQKILFVQDPLVGGMLVDQKEPLRPLRHDIGCPDLADHAQRRQFGHGRGGTPASPGG